MIRNAGLLRKLPDEDDLYLTIDGTMAVLRGVDIPRLLSGQEKPLFVNRRRSGTINIYRRPGYEDLIRVHLNNLEYTIWLDKFTATWNGRLQWVYIHERIPEVWTGFNSQEVTA